MDAASSGHPTRDALSSFGLGKLDESSAQAVNDHLEQCSACRKHVAEMSADSFLGRVRDAKVQAPAEPTTGDSRTSSGTFGQVSPQPATPPPANTLPPGLADHAEYQVKSELGRGGMGVVYLAHNTLMGRDEVLKVMSRHLMERPGVLERFRREIRAIARLRHPNIVTAYHATTIGESIVFSMEYVEGLDLSRMVKVKGPLPIAHACNFVYQAALGLQHAHEEGLVHRDIKPGNLMLASGSDKKATIKILDFGLARATREEKVDSSLTREGQALGTPDFIAPEQILDAQSADIRADIYSLGATLYYLLSGRPPFEAKSLYDMYQAHISQDASPLNFVRPEVPSELAALVAKMMAKEPARRFQTPGEVAQALAPFFKKGSPAFRATTTESSRGYVAPAAVPDAASGSSPTHALPQTAGTAVQPKVAAKPTVPDGRWESLIDLGDDVSSSESLSAARPATSATESPRRSILKTRWLWPSVTAGLLLLTLAAAWAVYELRIKTTDGTIVVSGVPEDAKVWVDKDEVKIIRPGSDGPVTVRAVPGRRKIRVEAPGFQVWGEEVVVESGRSAPMTAKLERLEANAASTEMTGANDARHDNAELPPADIRQGTATVASPTGYVSLFNGRNFDGWELRPEYGGDWKIIDGALEGRGEGGGREAVLVSSRQDYRDFRLRVDLLYTHGTGHIQLRRTETDGKWSGYLVTDGGWWNVREDGGRQIPNHGYFPAIGSVAKLRRVRVYGGPWALLSRPFPYTAERWNEIEVTVVKNRISTKVNGVTVSEYADAGEPYGSGRIALVCNEEANVRVRSVEIQELPVAMPRPPGKLAATENATTLDRVRIARVLGQGHWEVDGEELVQTTTDRNAHLQFGDQSWGDYLFSAEVKLVRSTAHVGLIFRNGGETTAGNYFCTFGPQGGDRGAMCSWIVDGRANSFRAITGKRYRDATMTLGKWHTIAVEVKGQQFRAYLDGVPVFEASDPAKTRGDVGFRAWESICRFRNIRITAPDGTVLWEGLPELSESRQAAVPVSSAASGGEERGAVRPASSTSLEPLPSSDHDGRSVVRGAKKAVGEKPDRRGRRTGDPGDDAAVVSLFNGKDLDGWEAFKDQQPTALDPSRFAREGMLHCPPNHVVGSIRTVASFKDFVVHLEYRIGAGAQDTRSGILLITDEDDGFAIVEGKQVNVGIVCRVEPGRTGDMVARGPGGGRLIRERQARDERPRGEWNQIEIRSTGVELTYLLNGKIVNRAELEKPHRFHFGFDGWSGSDVWYRNIRLRSTASSDSEASNSAPNEDRDGSSGGGRTRPRLSKAVVRRRLEELRQQAIVRMQHHVEVFSEEYAQVSGRSWAYANCFKDFRPRLQRLVASMELVTIPIDEMQSLSVEMKDRNVFLLMMSGFETPEAQGKAPMAWRDYAPAVRDIEWVIAQFKQLNQQNTEAVDPFRVGSLWTSDGGQNQRTVLLVLERSGERFKGRFVPSDKPLPFLEVNGTIRDQRVSWLGKDVVAKVPVQAPNHSGSINGDLINMEWSGNGVPGSGRYVLQLRKD